ncbi:MAG: TatD family deoxyribonuclease [Deltaproteobacteria bacterium]|nr:TatD family deoxyribonuclease [Deltaproteobacteria bacterium]
MLIDAHVHLDKYGSLLDEALRQIETERIFTVATAMDVPSYLELQKIGERSELVLPTFGIHPRRAAEYAGCLPELNRYIEMSPAIGEIGLDFHWVRDASTYPAQRKVLEYFIAAAAEQKKFVNLHTKAGEKEILDLLEKYNVRRAIIHWYSGPLDILQAMIDFGCYFTIGVEVHYSDYIKEIAKRIPDRLLLTETDNPGALKWLKKNDEIGMPKAIIEVVQTVAGLRESTAERIEQMVHANFSRLVANDPWLTNCAALLSRTAFADIHHK